jgi:hypothetical protein
MSIINSKTQHQLKKLCQTSYTSSREWKKLTQQGKEYLESLLLNCPSQNEQDFNKWVFSPHAITHRIDNFQQMISAQIIFIQLLTFLNKK